MKSIIVTSIAAGSLLAVLAVAQPQARPPRYTVTDLGFVGIGQPYFITNNGVVSGGASSPDGTDHAVIWYKRLKLDIGTPGLGGLNSVAFGANERGQAVGEAESSTPDPNGEDFCGFNFLGISPFHNTCLPFLWENGVMTALPTLGGNNGVVNQINNRGQAAGVQRMRRGTWPAQRPMCSRLSPPLGRKARSRNSPRSLAT